MSTASIGTGSQGFSRPGLASRRQWLRLVWMSCLALCLSMTAGCGKKKAVIAPPTADSADAAATVGSTQQGIASWYGHPYHGRRTANGEVYDMNKMTAAHLTFPFGTLVKVTNLDNQLSTRVRINDRGPFVRGRIIDLSRKAAEELKMIRSGTAPVKLEVVTEGGTWKGFFTVQVGAFRDPKNAEKLRKKLASEFDAVSVQDSPGGIHRVRVGRVAKRSDADQLAQRLRRHPAIEEAVVVEIPGS